MANFAPPLDPPMFVHVNKQAYIQCVFFQQNLNNVLTNKVCTYATYTMSPICTCPWRAVCPVAWTIADI
jgi:hypothetical protein